MLQKRKYYHTMKWVNIKPLSGYLIRVFALKIASGSDQISSPLPAPWSRRQHQSPHTTTVRLQPPSSGLLSYIKQPPEPNSHMQTPTQMATTEEWRQGTNQIAVLFQQQLGPPSI